MATAQHSAVSPSDKQSFLVRHEFLLRRLHSLSGLIPVGAFMCVHLIVNASILNGPETFQSNVFRIHSLGKLLTPVEWIFIFIPILFHAIFGFVIIWGGLPNSSKYRYGANWRYTLQRITGMIAFVFIMYHVFHTHGWFHATWWVEYVAKPLGGMNFSPYNASSTLYLAMQNPIIIAAYAIGVLASVFHLANGVWTMGITWGAWTTPKAQKNALYVCSVLGLLLAVVGMSALVGSVTVANEPGVEAIIERENEMYDAGVKSGVVLEDEHKRYKSHDETPGTVQE